MVDKKSTKRGTEFLERLAASGGRPVRVDTSGDDLMLLDALVQGGYAPNRAEAYRKAMREAHKIFCKNIKKALDTV